MPVRNLSSTVRFKSSDASPEVRKRYGLYDNDDEAVVAELNQHHSGDAWKQDQRLKNDITSVLHRLELESVKPGFDVLSQTGFRRGYQVRNRSPGEALHVSSSHLLPTERGRKPSRRHSYIEPRTVHRQVETTEHAAPIHVERTVRFIEPEPTVVHHTRERSYSPTWYYTEPSSYSFLQSTAPSRRRTVAQPEGGRALSEYRDTLTTAPTHHHQQQQKQRWSVYGTTPSVDWGRSRSTPPDVYRISTVTGDRIPVGDKLSRRRNHEYAIGVKLADSQRELDTFNRELDKRFGDSSISGGGGGNLWRPTSSYSVYPSYYPSSYYTSSYPTYYKYSAPVTSTDYSYQTYSPRTRVVSPSGTLVHGSPYSYSDYLPYTTTYSKYLPSYSYGRSSFSGYEPGYSYASYPRSSYYVGRSRYLL